MKKTDVMNVATFFRLLVNNTVFSRIIKKYHAVVCQEYVVKGSRFSYDYFKDSVGLISKTSQITLA